MDIAKIWMQHTVAMVNPLFVFFASRAGMVATVLRLTLAAFLLYAAVWNWRILSGGIESAENHSVLFWLSGGNLSGWVGVIFSALAGGLLLVGLFSRLVAFALLFLVLWCSSDVALWSAPLWKEMIFSAVLCLSSALAGGGPFSFDQKISNLFLPTL